MQAHHLAAHYADMLCRLCFVAALGCDRTTAGHFLVADLEFWGGNAALTSTKGMCAAHCMLSLTISP